MLRSARFMARIFILLLAAACAKEGAHEHDGPAAGINVSDTTECALDGMILANYPGPKAQIHYREGRKPDFFCETKEMFYVYLEPGRKAEVTALFVQETASIDWDKPVGNWMPARDAIYVSGSKLDGSMGPTFAPFKMKSDAEAFVKKYGGAIKSFEEIIKEIEG